MPDEILTTVNAQEAITRLGELLNQAAMSPVAITEHDRPMAYLVSRKDYEALLEKIQFLEDQLWLAKADAARAEGHVAKRRVTAFLQDFSSETDHEETAVHKAGS